MVFCVIFSLIRAKIEEFLKKDENGQKNIVLGSCTAFQRKLIYQEIEKDFHDKITAKTQTINNQKVITIERKWSTERIQKENEKLKDDDENEYRRLVGLSALLLKISQSVSSFSY